ncbi:DNA polymerase eta-like [Zea mays]|uniref:DNA polymerase eta-like n=1 Tax=Zea mays TaxID=4577 RepID=UPI00165222EC|nr:DNA polymerase eta-like [Zea mays]
MGLSAIRISSDTSAFPYTHRRGHRFAIRISCIISETFRLGLPSVRWFVMGDDDTVFFPDNLLTVLNKFDNRQPYYIGSLSESYLQNIYFSYGMAYGSGGFAISRPLAEHLTLKYALWLSSNIVLQSAFKDPRPHNGSVTILARPSPTPPITNRSSTEKVIICFTTIEQRRNPTLRGQPTAVVQYNGWKGGGLIAISYEARGFGVKRSMRGDEAKRVCSGINLVQVPVARGKADLNLYRSAGAEVVAILASKGKCERASIDEVYLDLTDAAKEMLLQAPPDSPEGIFMEAAKSNILGLPADASEKEKNVRAWLCQSEADYQEKLLPCGAIIVAQLRVRVLEETQFTCSAGIAHNKMLAKLVSGMHKPAQQTVVPSSSVQDLLASLPVKKMKQLGGKLGSSLQDDLGVETIGDLLSFTEEKLQEQYGVNTGTWLWKTARGISGEEVEDRLLPKSHGCGKTFPGPRALKYSASVSLFHGMVAAFARAAWLKEYHEKVLVEIYGSPLLLSA